LPPKIPIPKLPPSPIEGLREVIKQGRQQIEQATSDIRSVTQEIQSGVIEPPKETKPAPKAEGTACLACSRDHFSTTSAALSEALRFAHPEGMKHPEVVRRLGIALDELNILERIDLDPGQLGMLNEDERKLAIWALQKSRELRHSIGGVKTTEDLEKAAAKAGEVREEFMRRLWELPAGCDECFSLETLKEYIEKRREQAGGSGEPKTLS